MLLVTHLGEYMMKLNKFLVLIAFFVSLPILSMQPMDAVVNDRASRTFLSNFNKISSRFAPYPSPKRIKVIKALSKLNELFSKKTCFRTLGRKPSNEEKVMAAILALELGNDPLTI